MSLSTIFAYIASVICASYLVAYLFAILLGKRQSLARWAFNGSMALLTLESFAVAQSYGATNTNSYLFWQQLRLVSLSFLPGMWVLFSLTYARGNAGEFVSRWKGTIIAGFALPLLVAILYSDGYILFRQVSSDGNIALVLGWPGQAAHLLMIMGTVLSMTNLERTLRSAVGTMRWRVKYMLLGLGILFIARFYTSSQSVLFGSVEATMDTLNSVALIVSNLLILRALSRKGHFELELYPSHKMLSNSLTVLLAGAYLFIVGVLARIVTWIGGDAAFPIKAFGILLALALLATLLQSDRFRLEVKRFISRHFKRSLHDYRTIWQRFSEELSSQINRDDLCKTVVTQSSDVFQALSVSIWITHSDSKRLELTASTASTSILVSGDKRVLLDADKIISYFERNTEPLDLDESKEPWTKALQETNPNEFPHGGHRIVVPMICRDSLQGILVVGDRIGGADFAIQEFDMMKSVGSHTASALLNMQLSNKLVESKEMEAFQTMATFFVHDLKNATNTLNLMLKNMPKHWDNPEFRKDALRGIGRTSDRINHLITKLTQVRSEMELNRRITTTTKIIEGALDQWQTPSSIQFTTTAVADTRIEADIEKVRSVILNLLINATEAINGEGAVELVDETNERWAIISIKDDGPGMSQEFLRNSLFKPFKTTKNTGLGIGMYQSKMVMEAHGGSISVESVEGKGTTFKLKLPISYKTNGN